MDLTQYQNQFNTAQQAAQGYQHQLTDFQGSMKDPLSYYSDASKNLGVADTQGQMNTARDAVTKTNTLLSNLPQTVQGQVNGTLTNEAQRQGILAQQQAPLMQNYQTQNNNYGNLAQQYQNLLAQAGTQANLGFQGQQQKFQTLNDLYNNAFGQQNQALQSLQFGQQYNLTAAQNAAQQRAMDAQTAIARQNLSQQMAQIAATNAALSQQQAHVNSGFGNSITTPQANSLAWLNHNGVSMSPGHYDAGVSNYTSNPGISNWHQAAQQGNFFQGIGNILGAAFTGHF
jgi:hypothetical protein